MTQFSFLSRAFLSLSLVMTSTNVAAQDPRPNVSCAVYLQKIADAALAIGRASGHFHVYDAILPKDGKDDEAVVAFPGTQAWVVRERDIARQEVQNATAAAQTLGQPPERCGFERSAVTKPGIAVAQDEGIYFAYMKYADVAAPMGIAAKTTDGKSVTGTSMAKWFRQLAEKNYPPKVTAAKRAAFEADLAKLRQSFADR